MFCETLPYSDGLSRFWIPEGGIFEDAYRMLPLLLRSFNPATAYLTQNSSGEIVDYETARPVSAAKLKQIARSVAGYVVFWDDLKNNKLADVLVQIREKN